MLGARNFDGAATAGGSTKRQKAADEMQLVTNSGTVVATPSAPGSTQDAFNDCIWQTACAAP
jgi:hypothetical protein